MKSKLTLKEMLSGMTIKELKEERKIYSFKLAERSDKRNTYRDLYKSYQKEVKEIQSALRDIKQVLSIKETKKC